MEQVDLRGETKPKRRTEGKLIYLFTLLLAAATHRAEVMADKVKISPNFSMNKEKKHKKLTNMPNTNV